MYICTYFLFKSYVILHPLYDLRSLDILLQNYENTAYMDRLCGLVVRVLGYRSRGPGSIAGATRFSEK
jgi:hypothetical protein